MGLLSSLGKLSRNEARAVRLSQMGGSTMGHNANFGSIPEYMHEYLLRRANNSLGGGSLPNIGATGMSETEMEVTRMLQSGMPKEQIAEQLYQGGVPRQFVEIMLDKAAKKLMGAGELF